MAAMAAPLMHSVARAAALAAGLLGHGSSPTPAAPSASRINSQFATVACVRLSAMRDGSIDASYSALNTPVLRSLACPQTPLRVAAADPDEERLDPVVLWRAQVQYGWAARTTPAGTTSSSGAAMTAERPSGTQ